MCPTDLPEEVEPGVERRSTRALELIESSAARSSSGLPHAGTALRVLRDRAGRGSTNLARYDGVRYGHRSEDDTTSSAMFEETRARRLRRRGQAPHHARHVRPSPATTTPTTAGAAVRTRSSTTSRPPSRKVDLVVTPTSPAVAFGLGEKTNNPLAMYLVDLFTVPMSLAGIPAISIPAGLAAPDGGGPRLPVGFQIAAPAFGERSSSTLRMPSRRRSVRSPVTGGEPDGELEAVIGLEIHVQLPPGQRCSAAARSPSATSRTSTPAPSASPTPEGCRCPTRRPSTTP